MLDLLLKIEGSMVLVRCRDDKIADRGAQIFRAIQGVTDTAGRWRYECNACPPVWADPAAARARQHAVQREALHERA